MTTPVRRSTSRGARVATAVAACALALATPWAAQALPATKAPAPTPWKVALPLSQAQSGDFFDIDARTGTDAWAVGRTVDDSLSTSPLVKHWDGRRWSDVRPAATEGRPTQFDAVTASGPDDAWAAGTYTDVQIGSASAVRMPDRLAARLPGSPASRFRGGAAAPPATAGPIVLQHWDGTRWNRVPRPAPAEGWLRFVGDLTSFGRDSVWLTTADWNPVTNANAAQLEHWDGRTWQRTALPPAPNGAPVQPWSITGTGPDDVWVTAEADAGGTATPLLYHFDGRRWTVDTIPVPRKYDVGWVANHIVTTKRGTVQVFGKTNDGGVPRGLLAAQWDGRTWQPISLPDVDEVNAAGVDGSGKVWIAGWPVGSSHTVLSRWDGASWTDEQLPEDITTRAGSSILGIDGVPGTRGVLAAGDTACENTSSGACGLVVSRGIG